MLVPYSSHLRVHFSRLAIFMTFQEKKISDVRIVKLFPGTIDALRPKKDNSKMKDS